MASSKPASAPPPLTTAEKIREPKFKTVRRGLDPTEVKGYLAKVGELVQTLEGRARTLEGQVKTLEARLKDAEQTREQPASEAPTETFQGVSGQVTELMASLDADVDRIRREAASEAEQIVLDAKAEAALIETQATQKQAAAERMLKQTHTEAEQTMAEFRTRQESVRAELHASSARVLKLIADLESTLGPDQRDQPIVLEDAAGAGALASLGDDATLPDSPR